MKIKTVLFDLDGTLLPMDLDQFVKVYLGALADHLVPYGYDRQELIGGIWAGMKAMLGNDGSRRNEDAFWEAFARHMKRDVRVDEPLFEAFYREKFDALATVCGYTADAKQAVDYLKGRGICTVLATNPAFPSIATEKRMRWAGVEPSDFVHFTTYENSHYCKPNPEYYREILDRLGLRAEDCLMVGNDVTDDMVAEMLGMKVFLLTDWLINKPAVDINRYPHGGYAELMKYLEENCG